jgi:hypothetical protein
MPQSEPVQVRGYTQIWSGLNDIAIRAKEVIGNGLCVYGGGLSSAGVLCASEGAAESDANV